MHALPESGGLLHVDHRGGLASPHRFLDLAALRLGRSIHRLQCRHDGQRVASFPTGMTEDFYPILPLPDNFNVQKYVKEEVAARPEPKLTYK